MTTIAIIALIVVAIVISIIYVQSTTSPSSPSSPSSEEGESSPKGVIISSERVSGAGGVEFRLINVSPKDLKIYYENEDGILHFLADIEKSCRVYMRLLEGCEIVPGTILFSKFSDCDESLSGTVSSGDYAFKPYVLDSKDYSIYFGEVSTDFLRSTQTYSDRHEILSLKIINKGLTPYLIYYRGDFLGRVEAYHPDKFECDYSLLTRNNEKHFQIGTCLEFMLDSPGATMQSIMLHKIYTNIVYLGDVVGRNELNQ